MLKNKKKGFSLIEMMIVIAVIAVLVSIIIPTVGNSTVKANAATNAANLRSVSGQVTSGKLLGDFTINDATYTYFPENEVLTVMGGIEAPNSEECFAVEKDEIMWVQIQPDGTALCTYRGYGVDYFAYIAEHGTEPGEGDYYMTESNKLLNSVINRYEGYKDSYNSMNDRAKGGLDWIVSNATDYNGVVDFLDAMEQAALENNGQIPEEYAGIMNQISGGLGGGSSETPSTPETPESSEGEDEGSSSGGSCVTPDTMVTLANGTKKRMDQVTYSDTLLVWDFYKGAYAKVPASVIVFHGNDNYTVLTLTFEDGTQVKTIGGHDFFDFGAKEFVTINENNVQNYIGHRFVKASGSNIKLIKLVDYDVNVEYTGSYSVLSAIHNNFIVEDMISLTPLSMIETDNFFEYFEVGSDMKYDAAKMKADIDTYGLYTYDDFADYLTYEQYVALNAPYYKVLVGKGYITFEDLLMAISAYVK